MDYEQKTGHSEDDFQIRRKLTAILSADAVSYSRMMSDDEDLTLRILADLRRVVDAIIDSHEGRIVNTAGDSVLAEFSSPVEAVRCAIEMQDAIKTRNDTMPPDQRMLFRIGVNLGDVMISGTDLLGDGVNVAARLQGIAEPGGVCISSSVYDQISGKINLGFADLGEQMLKNITRPIRVYQLAGANVPIKSRAIRGLQKNRGPLLIAGGAVAIMAVSAAWLLFSHPSPKQEVSPVQKAEDAVRTVAHPPLKDESLRREIAEKERIQKELEQAKTERQKTRIQAELEVQRARTEGQAARMQAEIELQKARIEEQSARMQTELELQKARNEAELLKRSSNSAAETRAGSKAENTAAQQTPKPAESRKDPGVTVVEPEKAETAPPQWAATLSCEAFKSRPESRLRLPVTVTDGEFVIEKGKLGEPGYLFLKGKPADGELTMTGNFISSLAETRGRYGHAGLSGKKDGSKYHLKGRMGQRSCELELEFRK